jgi:hypothetical protein
MIALFSSGGASKSRQFEVLGELLAGKHGAVRRLMLLLALGAIGVGALTCFTAVGRMDAARRKQCQATCVERGYKKGLMGLSSGTDASNKRYKVCRCSEGPDNKELEIDTNQLPDTE